METDRASLRGAAAGFHRASLGLPMLASQVWLVSIPPFLTVIADDLASSPALVGQVVGLSLLAAAACTLVAGPLIDRMGPRPVILGGLIAVGLSSLGTAAAPGLAWLVVARLVGSLGRGSIHPAAMTAAVDAGESAQRRRRVSWAAAGAASAPLIGVPILTWLAETAGWRAAYLAAGLASLLVAGFVWQATSSAHRSGPAPADSAPSVASLRAALAHRPAATVLASSLAANTGFWAGITYLSVLYHQGLGLGVAEIGRAATAIGLGLLIGSVLAAGSWFGTPARAVLAATRVGAGLAAGVPFVLVPAALWTELMLGGAGVLLGMGAVVTPLLLRRDSPASSGTVQSLNWLALTLGIALGGALGGGLLTIGGLGAVGSGTIAFLWVAGAILLWPLPGHRAAHG